MTGAIGRGFIAVELQQIQRYRVEDLAQLATAGIDEQAHGGHERRQRGDDRPRLLHIDRPRALGIEHQTNGISACLSRCQRVLNAGNPTDFAANGAHEL
ncbi:hypothetical protein D3C75_1027680 [compost metagenome]